MRKKLAGALSVALAVGAAAVGQVSGNVPSANAAPAVPYYLR